MIKSDKPIYSLGEVPQIGGVITNAGRSAVWAIGCIQGSEETVWPVWVRDRFGVVWNVGKGRRYPRFVVELSLNDQPVTADIKGSVTPCGNLNALVATDFKSLGPGESFDPFGEGFFHLWTLRQPELWSRRGVYKLSLVYDLQQMDERKFRGDGNVPDFNERLKEVPRVTTRSNELTLEVR